MAVGSAVGMLVPGAVGDRRFLLRENTLVADGTWWKAWSGVTIDPEAGEVKGSRTKGVLQPDGRWRVPGNRVVDFKTGELYEAGLGPRVPGPRHGAPCPDHRGG
jgi:hypothetical protein